MGDVHGHVDVVRGHLRAEGLIDDADRWTGGDAVLWFMGDFTDRGPDGVGAIELAMSLQEQARDAGGRVDSLLGNHEVLILGVRRFGPRPIPGARDSFMQLWAANGGRVSDLDRLTDRHHDWMASRPAVALWEDRLLVHADTAMYAEYGETVDEVCRNVAGVLGSDDITRWDELMEVASHRLVFKRETRAIRWMLGRFGGTRIVHGHTPIPYMAKVKPEKVQMPLVYGDGMCVNVDGGIYMGGPGFLHLET